MRFAFVMNPLTGVDPTKDTTFLLISESLRRGQECFWLSHDDLQMRQSKPAGFVRKMTFDLDATPWWDLGVPKLEILTDFDAVFMRYDPPFDLRYLTATHILDHAVCESFVMNRPGGIRLANEKIYSLNFSQFIPKSLVTSSMQEIRNFVGEHGGRAIIKPLHYGAGHGIFLLRDDDPNINSIVETATGEGVRHVMVQEYLTEARTGDKRILMLNGKPIGATLRVPKPGELRGNIHAGATCAKTSLSDRESALCDAIGPRLVKDGLLFVGLDVIGGYLTEVNVTSPTGMQEINRLDNVQLERQVIDFAESSIS